jgi:MFS family permease
MTQKTNHRFSLSRQVQRTRDVINDFPRQFWILVIASFIDRLGGAMLFPFFTLYLTSKFGITMTQVGVIFALFAISSVLGSVVGGALTDRLGRKGMLLFGLVMSALASVLMGVIDQIEWFFIAVLIVGTLADAGGPAQQALVADLLPEEKRAQGFGILRVVFNLAVVIGPLIGGLLASSSYMLLFISDAVTSLITAVIVYFTLHETYRPEEHGQETQSIAQTFAGYGKALRDKVFIWFLVASALMALVYIQMNTTLAVYLRDEHNVSVQGFSYILALNAAMVVLFQFPITRRISGYRPLNVMAVGTLLYAIGFAMYGMVSAYLFFLAAMVVITLGEMLVSPVGQAIVAQLAPEDMRGRYMAVFGFSWVIPFAIGPLLAGLVMDNLNPNLLWLSAGVIGLVAAATFYWLERQVDRARWAIVDNRLSILEQFEMGQITAETASARLDALSDNAWARLAPQSPPGERRHLRIRLSDLSTGMMRVDLRLPMGLINTVLYMGGRVSADLDSVYAEHLREMITHSDAHAHPQQLDADGKRLEVSLE